MGEPDEPQYTIRVTLCKERDDSMETFSIRNLKLGSFWVDARLYSVPQDMPSRGDPVSHQYGLGRYWIILISVFKAMSSKRREFGKLLLTSRSTEHIEFV